MKDKQLREMFRESENNICIDAERKEKTLCFLNEEINRKKILLYDKKIIIKNQFIYMHKTSLVGSIVGSLVIMVLIAFFSEFGWKNREVIASSCFFSAILSMLSLVGVSNIFSSRLSELEESCYFNVKQGVAFQLISHGIISLAVLMIVTILVGAKWNMMFFQAGLYVFVPYVLTLCCCLLVLITKVGRQSSYMIFVVGIFASIAFSVISMIPWIYSTSAIAIWILAFLIGIALLKSQIRNLFYEIGKGEILCMN
ncbi:MAG: hypothetical protein ACRC7V_01525 [Lachnospiraceae bacterium]